MVPMTDANVKTFGHKCSGKPCVDTLANANTAQIPTRQGRGHVATIMWLFMSFRLSTSPFPIIANTNTNTIQSKTKHVNTKQIQGHHQVQ